MTNWSENRGEPGTTSFEPSANVLADAERLALALEAADGGLWDWNLDTDEVYLSPRWKAMLGYGPEELPDHLDTWLDLIHPDDRQSTQDRVQRFLDGKDSRYETEFRLSHKAGRWVDVLSLAVMACDEHGQPITPRRLVGIHRDISGTKQIEGRLEESVSLLRATLDSTADGLLVVDTDGKFNAFNQKFTELWQISPESMETGTSEEIQVMVVDQLADPEGFRKKVSDLYHHPDQESFDTLKFKDGRVFERYSRPQKVDGRFVGRVWSFRDVTARIKSEEEIRNYLVNEVRIRKRAEKAVQEALAAERETARLKNEFLTNISHEFRTPMNGIIGMTDATLATSLTKTQRDNLDMVKASAGQLLEIMNNIFEFSRVETGGIRLATDTFCVRDLINRNLLPLAARAAERGLQLSSVVDDGVPTHLEGDTGCLQQVLRHVVDNAIEFTCEGTVQVRFHWLADTPAVGSLAVEVQDTGIGIPADRLEAVFETFCQVDGSYTRAHGGTGIGLSLCRQLLQLMGGSINVESTLGVGSIFRFQAEFHSALSQVEKAPQKFAPVKSSEAIGAVEPEKPYAEVENLRILLVEDMVINQKVASLILSRKGHQVTVAENGQRALEILADKSFDLVLMDIQMPVMNGFEATARIRAADSSIRDLPIIAVTAHTLQGDRERCLQAGMDEYVPKPINAGVLLRTISKVIHRVAVN